MAFKCIYKFVNGLGVCITWIHQQLWYNGNLISLWLFLHGIGISHGFYFHRFVSLNTEYFSFATMTCLKISTSPSYSMLNGATILLNASPCSKLSYPSAAVGIKCMRSLPPWPHSPGNGVCLINCYGTYKLMRLNPVSRLVGEFINTLEY